MAAPANNRQMVSAEHTKLIRSGWLTKQGSFFKTWRKRWFELYGNGRFVYYKTEEQAGSKGGAPKAPLGQLSLYGAAVLFVVSPKIPAKYNSKNVIELNTPKRTLYFYADNLAEAQEWILVLHQTSIRVTTSQEFVQQRQAEAERRRTVTRAVLQQVEQHVAADEKQPEEDEDEVAAVLQRVSRRTSHVT